MDLKAVFKPNLKNCLISLLLFIIMSSMFWTGILEQTREFGLQAFGSIFKSALINSYVPIIFIQHIKMVAYLSLIPLLIIAYILGAIFVYYFRFEYLKEMSISLKLIILFLFFVLIGYANVIGANRMHFFAYITLISQHSTLLLILLVTSIIFLMIRIRFNWLIGSLYFLYILFQPFRMRTYQGTLIAAIQALFDNVPRIFIYLLIDSLFFIAVIVYLVIYLRNNFKYNEKPLFVILVITYLARQFNLGMILIGQRRISQLASELIWPSLLFAILICSHYFLKKK